jgi:hypothetical protein
MSRLGALADRRIADRDRRPAFRYAALLLIAAAIVLLLLPDGEPPSISPLRGSPAARYRAPDPPPAPASGPVAAARRFLAGFLPFLYGQGSSDMIRAAAPALADRIARSRLRVPPAALDRHPRVTQLESRRLGKGRVSIEVRIEDGGVASYPIALTLARHDGRWLVVAEGID